MIGGTEIKLHQSSFYRFGGELIYSNLTTCLDLRDNKFSIFLDMADSLGEWKLKKKIIS